MRIIIVGGPRTGKSTLAREYRAQGIPTFCGDPRSKCKEPEAGVTYLPEAFAPPEMWSPGSQFVAETWFNSQGPWVMEGQIMARALRKWEPARLRGPGGQMVDNRGPADKIIVLRHQYADAVTMPGQVAMHKGVMKVWDEIAWRFAGITEER